MEFPDDFKPLQGVETFSTESSVNWLHEEILFIYAKSDIEHDIDQAKKGKELIRQILNDKDVPMICDVRTSIPLNKEVRDFYGTDEGLKNCKSFTFIVDTAFSRVVANFFMGFKKLPIPIRMFSSVKEAIEWSKQYVNLKIREV